MNFSSRQIRHDATQSNDKLFALDQSFQIIIYSHVSTVE